MGGFSLIHWLILGVVVLLLFGGNRFSAMMGDVAKGLKSFKQGMSEDDEAKPAEPQRSLPPQQQAQQQQQYAPPPAQPETIDLTPRPPHPPTDTQPR